MDKNKVKLALHSAEDDVSIIINKFLDAETFNLRDLCWWWDPSKNWWANEEYAEIALKILIKERCCIRISGAGGWTYKKSEMFIDLLLEILRVEELLKGT